MKTSMQSMLAIGLMAASLAAQADSALRCPAPSALVLSRDHWVASEPTPGWTGLWMSMQPAGAGAPDHFVRAAFLPIQGSDRGPLIDCEYQSARGEAIFMAYTQKAARLAQTELIVTPTTRTLWTTSPSATDASRQCTSDIGTCTFRPLAVEQVDRASRP